MRDGVGIEAESFHFFPCSAIVSLSCSRGEEKLCLALWGISFHGHNNCWTNQDTVSAGLGCDERAFLNAIAFPQLGWNDYRATLADFYCFH